MFIAVQHTISDPQAFWREASKAMPSLPKDVVLRQSFPSPDGTRAICIWEAGSVEILRNLLEAVTGPVSRNEYFAVENGEGVTLPKKYQQSAGAA